jgi:hypothetical protein
MEMVDLKYGVILLFFVLICSCKKGEKQYPDLSMSADEIVHCMVEMYTINAAININDFSFRYSTTAVYYGQLSKISGKSVTTIKQDFEKLLLMPDSMLVLQNRALDTLRAIQDKTINKTTINIGIN